MCCQIVGKWKHIFILNAFLKSKNRKQKTRFLISSNFVHCRKSYHRGGKVCDIQAEAIQPKRKQPTGRDAGENLLQWPEKHLSKDRRRQQHLSPRSRLSDQIRQHVLQAHTAGTRALEFRWSASDWKCGKDHGTGEGVCRKWGGFLWAVC